MDWLSDISTLGFGPKQDTYLKLYQKDTSQLGYGIYMIMLIALTPI